MPPKKKIRYIRSRCICYSRYFYDIVHSIELNSLVDYTIIIVDDKIEGCILHIDRVEMPISIVVFYKHFMDITEHRNKQIEQIL